MTILGNLERKLRLDRPRRHVQPLFRLRHKFEIASAARTIRAQMRPAHVHPWLTETTLRTLERGFSLVQKGSSGVPSPRTSSPSAVKRTAGGASPFARASRALLSRVSPESAISARNLPRPSAWYSSSRCPGIEPTAIGPAKSVHTPPSARSRCVTVPYTSRSSHQRSHSSISASSALSSSWSAGRGGPPPCAIHSRNFFTLVEPRTDASMSTSLVEWYWPSFLPT